MFPNSSTQFLNHNNPSIPSIYILPPIPSQTTNFTLIVPKDESETPLNKLRALSPGNCVCVDCNSKDPDWASFNLGVLLCIDCSGVHRSLGVRILSFYLKHSALLLCMYFFLIPCKDISKVRSLSLDQWEPDLLAMMCGLGNEFVNSIYEANIPEERAKPMAPDSRYFLSFPLFSRLYAPSPLLAETKIAKVVTR